MPVTVTHAFVSAKADGADASVVRPSDWNAGHTVSGSSETQPNLCLNGDVGRRTTFALAMPEAFADTSGYAVVSGAAPTVGSSIVTSSAANELAWCNQSFVWRDGRASATFKAVSTTGQYRLNWRIDSTNFVDIQRFTDGTLYLQKVVAGVSTTIASVVQALTLNRWYWNEIEKQGTTWIGKIYDTGGTASGVTKASSTLLQTLSGIAADAGLLTGAHVGIQSDQAAAQWGGIAASPGGVYVETWLPESWSVTFSGTLGGQAIGYDDAADAGPNSGGTFRQWAGRGYIPATSRSMDATQTLPDGSIGTLTAFTASIYMKVAGKTGGNPLIRSRVVTYPSDLSGGGGVVIGNMDDAGETTWTRKTATATTVAADRRAKFLIHFNPTNTDTGTAYFQLTQLELGSAATAWHAAPSDDAPMTVQKQINTASTGSATFVEADPRDLAINLFVPWDCVLNIEVPGDVSNTSGANSEVLDITVDGVSLGGSDGIYALFPNNAVANIAVPFNVRGWTRVSAGKHRIAFRMRTSGGTATLGNGAARITQLIVTAVRGK